MPALSRREAGLIAGVAIVLALWTGLSRGSAMPPVSPMGDQPTYSVADPPAVVLIEPVLHAPWLGHVPPAAASAAAVIVLLAGVTAGLAAGASPLAAVLIVCVMAADRAFAAVLGHGGWMALSIGAIWAAMSLAVLGGLSGRRARGAAHRWGVPLGVVAAWVLAVWWCWLSLAAWPVVAAGLWRIDDRTVRWTAIGLSVVLGGAAFMAYFASMAAHAQSLSFMPGSLFDWRDTLDVAFDARPRVPPDSYVPPAVSTRLPHLVVFLIAVGGATAALPKGGRRSLAIAGLLVLGLVLAWPVWRAEAIRFALWTAAPLAAAGLTRMAASPGRPRLGMAIAVALAVVMGAERVATGARPLAADDARGFRDALQHAVESRGDGPVALVAEDTRIDSAIVSWMPSRTGTSRLVTDGAVVAAAAEDGREVLAGWGARRQLQLQGLHFATRVDITDPLPYTLSSVDAAYRCTLVRSDRWNMLPGLEYTGRLGIQLPPALAGELRVVVGDTLPLRLRTSMADGRPFPARLEMLLSGPAASAPPADYWLDGGAPEAAPDRVSLVHIAPHPVLTTLVSLHLGRRSPHVLARLDGYSPSARARICAAPVAPDLATARDVDTVVPLAEDGYFGTGWYGVEGQDADRFRWADMDAVVLVPVTSRGPVAIELVASPADMSGPAAITLTVNGIPLSSSRPMAPGPHAHTWTVPAGTWLAGVNELWFHVSRAVRPADTGGTDTRSLAMAVTRLTVTAQ